MPLPVSPRQLIHTRSITVSAYRRDDGLWDIEAHLVDLKNRDFPLASGIRPKGMPVHDMTLCVTIDRELNVVGARARSDATPYPGECEMITPDYEGLVGLNLMRGFRQAVRERFAGVSGCTHLTELTAVLPTAAIQGIAGETLDTGGTDEKPFQIDRCHALRADGAAVRRYYPKWYRNIEPPTRPGCDPAQASPAKESA